MREYRTVFQNQAGHTVTREIPGTDQADARAYAESCCTRGYKITSMKLIPHTCHYCGQPAYKLGFFGEHVCSNCQ